MIERKYNQYGTKLASMEIIHYECSHCLKIKLHKNWIDKTGKKDFRNIVQNEIALPEWESIKADCKEAFEDQYPQKDNWIYGKTTEKQLKDGTIKITHSRIYFNSGRVRENIEGLA